MENNSNNKINNKNKKTTKRTYTKRTYHGSVKDIIAESKKRKEEQKRKREINKINKNNKIENNNNNNSNDNNISNNNNNDNNNNKNNSNNNINNNNNTNKSNNKKQKNIKSIFNNNQIYFQKIPNKLIKLMSNLNFTDNTSLQDDSILLQNIVKIQDVTDLDEISNSEINILQNINFNIEDYNSLNKEKYKEKLQKYECDSSSILFLYINIIMNCDVTASLKTNIEFLTMLGEINEITTKAKRQEYKNNLLLLNNDILKENGEIYLSKLLNINCLLNKNNTTNTMLELSNINYNTLIEIKSELNYSDIKDNYTVLYYDEYNYLYNCLANYKNNHRNKINYGTLVNLYMFLKMQSTMFYNINTKNGYKDNKIYYLSRKRISLYTGIPEGTVENYLKILEEFNLIEIKKGSNIYHKANCFRMLTPWENN